MIRSLLVIATAIGLAAAAESPAAAGAKGGKIRWTHKKTGEGTLTIAQRSPGRLAERKNNGSGSKTSAFWALPSKTGAGKTGEGLDVAASQPNKV